MVDISGFDQILICETYFSLINTVPLFPRSVGLISVPKRPNYYPAPDHIQRQEALS